MTWIIGAGCWVDWVTRRNARHIGFSGEGSLELRVVGPGGSATPDRLRAASLTCPHDSHLLCSVTAVVAWSTFCILLAFWFWGRDQVVTWSSFSNGKGRKTNNEAGSWYEIIAVVRPRQRLLAAGWPRHIGGGEFCQENLECVIGNHSFWVRVKFYTWPLLNEKGWKSFVSSWSSWALEVDFAHGSFPHSS